MITYASQQGAPWSGFNGFGGLGALAGWTLNPITGVWTAPDGTGGWARNADGTFTASVVDGLGNVIVYTVDETMAPYTTSTIAPGTADGLTTFVDTLSDVWARIARIFGPAPSTGVTPVPAGSVSLLNPGTWSLPMILLIGGGVYWLASRGAARRRSGARRNPRRRSQARVVLRHLSAKEEMARYSPDQIRRALIRFGVSPSAARVAVARDR